MNDFALLDWDSDFFGIRVARILPLSLRTNQLKSILEKLRHENVTLAYWASDSGDPESEAAGHTLGGFLADRKVTYLLDLRELDESSIKNDQRVEVYESATPTHDLEQLAVQSGEYSRFNLDPRISRERFEEMYRLWIRSSVAKKRAEAVMVIRETMNRTVGMVTLGHQNGKGDIGLIAVDAGSRGKGYGRALVASSLMYFLSKGDIQSQVVTQRQNVAACGLYESFGYRESKCENLFHFWLD